MMLYGNTESAPDQLHLGRLSFVIEEPCRSHPNPYCMSHLRMSGRVWLVILSEAKDLLIQPGQILRRSTPQDDSRYRLLGKIPRDSLARRRSSSRLPRFR